MSILANPKVLAILIAGAVAASVSSILFHMVFRIEETVFREIADLNDKHAALDKQLAVLEERVRIWKDLHPELEQESGPIVP